MRYWRGRLPFRDLAKGPRDYFFTEKSDLGVFFERIEEEEERKRREPEGWS